MFWRFSLALPAAGLLLRAVALAQPPAPSPSPQTGQAGPQPTVSFRMEVGYVEVDALVTDRQGKVVRDLRMEDFQVFEDGRPQKLELFSVVDIPVPRPEPPSDAPRPEPDVKSNERPFAGRLYVLVLDDLHTAALRSARVKAAARRFIENHLGGEDLAAVVHASGRVDASQDFTNNRRLLLAAVDKFIGRKLRSATLNKIDEYNMTRDTRQQGDPIRDPEEAERGHHARSTLDTLKNIGDWLRGIRGRRKTVLFISEGIDYNIHDVFNNRDATTILDGVRDAVGAASRSNVSFYTLDPRGLGSMFDESMDLTPVEDPSLGLNSQGLESEMRLAQDSLRVLADETAGFATVSSNDFKGAFDRIVQENSAYYVLGYNPPSQKRDGRFHRIEVKVLRPGLRVRARSGYASPRGRAPAPELAQAGTSAPLREALGSPLQESGLPLSIHAAPFKGVGGSASVLLAVQVDGRHFQFTEKDGLSLDTLELSTAAVDNKGKVKGGARSEVNLKLKPQTRRAVEAAGFRALSRLDLPAGRYQLRVAGRASGSGAVGSVHYDLEVPDFTKEPLVISGIVLAARLPSLVPTARPDEQLKDVLPGPPTTWREFSARDTLSAFAEIYDNRAAQPHKVELTASVRTADGRVAFRTEEVRSSEELGAKGDGYGFLVNVPLQEVPPGPCVLRIEARSRLSGSGPPVAREVPFTVVAAPQPPTEAPAGGQPSTADGQRSSGGGRALVDVVKGPRSGVEAYEEVVARNEDEWQRLWSRLQLQRAAPSVTFQNTMIVAVFLGTRPTTGYAVEFAGVKREGDALVLEYVEQAPAEGAVTAQVLTTPFAVAGTVMHAGPVIFRRAAP
jgi:VWFA-related protein